MTYVKNCWIPTPRTALSRDEYRGHLHASPWLWQGRVKYSLRHGSVAKPINANSIIMHRIIYSNLLWQPPDLVLILLLGFQISLDDRISEIDFDFSILNYIHGRIDVTQNIYFFHSVSQVMEMKVEVIDKMKPLNCYIWNCSIYSNLLSQANVIIVHLVHSISCTGITKFRNFLLSSDSCHKEVSPLFPSWTSIHTQCSYSNPLL